MLKKDTIWLNYHILAFRGFDFGWSIEWLFRRSYIDLDLIHCPNWFFQYLSITSTLFSSLGRTSSVIQHLSKNNHLRWWYTASKVFIAIIADPYIAIMIKIISGRPGSLWREMMSTYRKMNVSTALVSILRIIRELPSRNKVDLIILIFIHPWAWATFCTPGHIVNIAKCVNNHSLWICPSICGIAWCVGNNTPYLSGVWE